MVVCGVARVRIRLRVVATATGATANGCFHAVATAAARRLPVVGRQRLAIDQSRAHDPCSHASAQRQPYVALSLPMHVGV